MSRYFYHPLGEENHSKAPFTRPGHGVGKLDISGDKMPLYAMCDGTIQFSGTYEDRGITACHIETTATGLKDAIWIRYLHGDYSVKTGDTVQKGDLIGYSGSHGTDNAHLHIDFCWTGWDSKGEPQLISGVVSDDKKTYKIKNTTYNLRDDIDWNKVEEWRSTNGGTAIGYGWLVMASKVEYQSAVPSASYAGWSTKGQTSVPKYDQWYASSTEARNFRAQKLKEHGITDYTDWANMPYGRGDVAGNACGACAFSNAISGQLGQEITPDLIVSYLNSKGHCTVQNALACAKDLMDKYSDITIMDLYGTKVTNGARYSSWNSGEVSSKPTSRQQTVDMDKVDNWLKQGACIVMSIGPNTSWGGKNTSGHFICVYGYDSSGYYVTDSRGATAGYALDTPYDWSVVFTGGVQGPFVVINNSKL